MERGVLQKNKGLKLGVRADRQMDHILIVVEKNIVLECCLNQVQIQKKQLQTNEIVYYESDEMNDIILEKCFYFSYTGLLMHKDYGSCQTKLLICTLQQECVCSPEPD